MRSIPNTITEYPADPLDVAEQKLEVLTARQREYIHENRDLKLQVVALETQLQSERERADMWRLAYEGKFTKEEG